MRSAGLPTRRRDFGCFGQRVDEVAVGLGQRLDAIGQPRRGGLLGGQDPRLFGARGVVRRGDATLRRRAVHQIGAAQLGAEIDRGAQDVDALLPHRAIGRGDRQAGGCGQQPVQPAHFEAGIGTGRADTGTLGGRHAPCIVAEGEGRQFEAGIAQPRRQRALPLEGKLADHLVAERKLHR